MRNDPQTLVIDSSILLAAIGQRTSRLRLSLEHDRNLESRKIDPFKARATLLAALTTHTLLIPRAVIRQMESLLRSPTLSEKNCAHLRSLIEVLEPYSVNAFATRQDLFQQRNALECLEASANLHAANLGEEASASHPVCQAWSRLAPYLPAARNNIENLLSKPHISETEQDALLCFADLRDCELQANDQEQPPECSELDPVICKILNDFLETRPNAKEHFASLAPETLEKAPLHIQAASLYWLAETLRPFLFPEFEVILLARDAGSAILTLNPDFGILRKFLPILKKLPYPLSTLDGFQLQPTPQTRITRTRPHQLPMTIPTLSNALRTALAQSLAALPDKSPDEDLAMMQALKHVIQRIHQGETGLYEPLHKGDALALTLGEME